MTLPVTLLTGYLGAGKTTLLNHLLRDPDAGRIAVVMNEFGDVGLDHDLVRETTEDMVLLQSGCVCCSVRGDLVQGMVDLASRRAKGELTFDRVVIETTGLADPGPIVQTLALDRELEQAFHLDGVVTVVDCANGARTLDAEFEAVAQVAMADRLILTKGDLVLPAERAVLERRLRKLNPGARQVLADHGAVPLPELFGIGSRKLEWVNATAYAAPVVAQPKGAQDYGLFGFGKPKVTLPTGPGHHDGRISSVSITIDQPVPAEVFDFWLDGLIARRGRDVLRIKGIVFIEGLEKPFAIHGVQHVFHPPEPLDNWPATDQTTRIVVIGRDMPRDELMGSLEILKLRP